MTNNIPYFELNGQRYEIRRNRYLQAEFKRYQEETALTETEEKALAKENDVKERIEKLQERKNELYEKFLETLDEKDEEMYNKACVAYNKLIEQETVSQNISSMQNKKFLDFAEKLVIMGLQYDREGNQIRTFEEASDVWSKLVDEYGKFPAVEFVVYTANYIIGADEEIENPFMTQAKAKAEQKANMKKGILKAK